MAEFDVAVFRMPPSARKTVWCSIQEAASSPPAYVAG
jgi:hypothetical protein